MILHTFCMSAVNIRKIFGENVKFYRKKEGLSQEQLAEKLEISINHLSIIENGKQFVTYNLLEKMIEVFNVAPSALFYADSFSLLDESLQSKISALVHNEMSSAEEKIQNHLRDL